MIPGDQRQFFRSHCDMLFLKRGKMNYHGHSVGVWTLTMSSMFTLDGVYVPTQKQTGNLQGSWKGADHGLRALVECLTDRICCFCAFPLKKLQVAERKGHLIVQSRKSRYPTAFDVIVLPSVGQVYLARLTDMQNLGNTMVEHVECAFQTCSFYSTCVLHWSLSIRSLCHFNIQKSPGGREGRQMWSLNTLVYRKKERNLLTLKEGECISPFLHYIGPRHRLRVMFGIWPVEWLQHASPDDWKVLESTPSFCCSALVLAQFRSIQYRWDYCVMQNASSCSYALLWTFPCCLCNDRQQCLPSITG